MKYLAESTRIIWENFRKMRAEHPRMFDRHIFKKIQLECFPFELRVGYPYAVWLEAIRRTEVELMEFKRTGAIIPGITTKK